MSSIYQEWGFKQNPFQQTPLPPNADGQQLLVGRDDFVTKLMNRISSPPKMATVEGNNGIGKTSVINVAAYNLFEKAVNAVDEPLFVPCGQTFQLDRSPDSELFAKKVILEVASTLCVRADELRKRGVDASMSGQIDRLVNSPYYTNVSAQLGAFGFSAGGGISISQNTSEAFDSVGFEDIVDAWLKELYQSDTSGGVVCTIDNMELLKTSKEAAATVEKLRDRLFNKHGLRWVLCGATGIVRGAATSPRMNGYMYSPIEIPDLPDKFAQELFDARINVYSGRDNCFLPLDSKDLALLFEILHGNIRDALSEADTYCMHYYEGSFPDDIRLRDVFMRWLRKECEARVHAVKVPPKAWEVFEQIVSMGGQCSPGDYESLGFDTPQAMRSQILSLESAQLIQSVRDEDDNRRKTIIVTSSGWMVKFARDKGLDTIFAEVD